MSERSKNKHRKVDCPECNKPFRSDNLKRHLSTHSKLIKECRYCKKQIPEINLLKHETLCQDKVDERLCNRSCVDRLETMATCTSVSGFFNVYELKVEQSNDYDVILKRTCNAANLLLQDFVKYQPVKVQIVVDLLFYKQTLDGREESEKVFRSLCEPLILGDNISSLLNRAESYIRARIEEYERHGSGWIFDQFHCLQNITFFQCLELLKSLKK